VDASRTPPYRQDLLFERKVSERACIVAAELRRGHRVRDDEGFSGVEISRAISACATPDASSLAKSCHHACMSKHRATGKAIIPTLYDGDDEQHLHVHIESISK
jgi:hypothetical protein